MVEVVVELVVEVVVGDVLGDELGECVVEGFGRFFILATSSLPVPNGRAGLASVSAIGRRMVRIATVAMVIRDRARRAIEKISTDATNP